MSFGNDVYIPLSAERGCIKEELFTCPSGKCLHTLKCRTGPLRELYAGVFSTKGPQGWSDGNTHTVKAAATTYAIEMLKEHVRVSYYTGCLTSRGLGLKGGTGADSALISAFIAP